MRKYVYFTLAVFFLQLLTGSIQAQNDDTNKKDKKDKKDKISINFDKNAIPSDVKPGETFGVNFTVKNNSKKAELDLSGLTYEIDAPFTGSLGISETFPVIPPGEEKTFTLSVTAPNNDGKEKLEIKFFNDGKKKKQLEKMINVGNVSNTEIKQGDDGNKKTDDKEKNKGKEDKKLKKEKNKESND